MTCPNTWHQPMASRDVSPTFTPATNTMTHCPQHNSTTHLKLTQKHTLTKECTLWDFIQPQIPAPLAPLAPPIPPNPIPESQHDLHPTLHSTSNTHPSTPVLNLDTTSQQNFSQLPNSTNNDNLHQKLLHTPCHNELWDNVGVILSKVNDILYLLQNMSTINLHNLDKMVITTELHLGASVFAAQETNVLLPTIISICNVSILHPRSNCHLLQPGTCACLVQTRWHYASCARTLDRSYCYTQFWYPIWLLVIYGICWKTINAYLLFQATGFVIRNSMQLPTL